MDGVRRDFGRRTAAPWRRGARASVGVCALGAEVDNAARSAVVERLIASNPGLHVNTGTILRERGQSTWVLELADEAPTAEEQALVGVRVDELLP